MEVTFELLILDEPTKSTGRVYSTKEAQKMVSSLERKKHPFLCENDKDYNLDFSSDINTVNIANVSHELLELFIEDNKLNCKLLILDTPAGKALKNIIEMYPEENLKCSPIGTGTFNIDGNIVTNYTLRNITIKPNWNMK